jgi:hypothetical protein
MNLQDLSRFSSKLSINIKGIQNFEWGHRPPLAYTWVRPSLIMWYSQILNNVPSGTRGGESDNVLV